MDDLRIESESERRKYSASLRRLSAPPVYGPLRPCADPRASIVVPMVK